MPKTTRIFIAIIALAVVAFSLTLDACSSAAYQIDETKLITSTPAPVIFVEPTAYAPAQTPEPDLTDDIYWLARCMEAEAGIDWLDWEIMMIGEVVLNRVNSPYFPDTVREVVLQPGQYAPFSGEYQMINPSQRYVELAERLLDGERVLNDPDVVWQALFEQGSSIVKLVYDPVLGSTTYFCK